MSRDECRELLVAKYFRFVPFFFVEMINWPEEQFPEKEMKEEFVDKGFFIVEKKGRNFIDERSMANL